MILVEAPEGWVLPAASNSGVEKTGGDSDSEFADIDSILKQKQGTGPKSGKGQTASKGNPQQRRATTASQKQAQPVRKANPESQPILPNEDWIAGATQRKRRNLLLGVGAVGLLALMSVVVLYLASNRSKGKPEVVEQVDNPNKLVTAVPSLDAGPETEEVVEPAPDVVEKPVENNPEAANTIENSQPAAEETTDGSDDRSPAETEVTEQPTDSPEVTEEVQSVPSPFGGGLEDILDQRSLQDPTSSNSLADLLEDSGSSITDISQEASAISDRRQIGLPKYFIKPPAALDPKNLERFNDPVGGLQYNGQSLLAIVAELSQITGVPISFDCDQLSAIQFDFGATVDAFQVKDSDFQTGLEKLLISLDDRLGIQYNGASPATISVADVEAIGTATFDGSTSKSKTAEEFIELIRQLIEPSSWENDQTSIKLENDQIAVVNSSFVRQRVRKFVESWNMIASARAAGSWPDSLKSKTKTFATTRSLPNSFRNKYSLPCSIYLAEVQKASGVNIVIDFNTLIAFGWNQNTKFPADIDEPTVGKLVDELAHSMDVDSRIIDEWTIELTDARGLAAKTDLEFYDVSKLLAGRINAANLVALVRESLQNTSSEYLRVYLDTEIESLIVIGPQTVQQRLEALLDRVTEIESK